MKFLCTNKSHKEFTYQAFQKDVIFYQCLTCKKWYIRDDIKGNLYEKDTKIMIYENKPKNKSRHKPKHTPETS